MPVLTSVSGTANSSEVTSTRGEAPWTANWRAEGGDGVLRHAGTAKVSSASRLRNVNLVIGMSGDLAIGLRKTAIQNPDYQISQSFNSHTNAHRHHRLSERAGARTRCAAGGALANERLASTAR